MSLAELRSVMNMGKKGCEPFAIDMMQAAAERKDEDWFLCSNGTRHAGAVKAAVNEFATAHKLSVFVTYGDAPWPTWMIWKP